MTSSVVPAGHFAFLWAGLLAGASPTVCEDWDVAPADVFHSSSNIHRPRRSTIAALQRGLVLYGSKQTNQRLALSSSFSFSSADVSM
jgi:hypothetical protein